MTEVNDQKEETRQELAMAERAVLLADCEETARQMAADSKQAAELQGAEHAALPTMTEDREMEEAVRLSAAEAATVAETFDHFDGDSDARAQGSSSRETDLQSLLDDGRWVFVPSAGGHKKYKRTVLMMGAEKSTQQLITMPCTPSDHRWRANAVADLRRKDDGVEKILSDLDEGTNANQARKHMLYKERKREEERHSAEMARIVMEISSVEASFELS